MKKVMSISIKNVTFTSLFTNNSHLTPIFSIKILIYLSDKINNDS